MPARLNPPARSTLTRRKSPTLSPGRRGWRAEGAAPAPWRGASGSSPASRPPTPSSGSAASCTPRRPRLGSSRMGSAASPPPQVPPGERKGSSRARDRGPVSAPQAGLPGRVSAGEGEGGRLEPLGGEAVLSVFTRTPRLESRLGRPAVLHCGFSAPASAFSVEWRHQFRGAGKVVLAFDGASRGVSVAEEGAELLLDAEGGGASLRLRSVAVRHEGTYICTVYLPHLHAQQALEFKVVEPPQVTLRPSTLSVPPGARPQLACEVSGFFPLGASVSWKRRGSGAPQDAFLDIGDSGHRQAPDGTFSFTSFARLLPVPTEDHGVSYVCHVGHAGLGEAGVKKAVVLHVAGGGLHLGVCAGVPWGLGSKAQKIGCGCDS
uniref:Ig-like domain-containing protein n=1 Tax=Podarcis muralis TaxID=64176 RepID=A0A670KIB7_PODMU